MAIQFFGSPTPTIGVEVEIQLIDPETRDLIPKSIALLEHCRTQGIERVKAEITQSMAEIDTEISKDVKECRGYLEKRIAQIRSVARELGIQLAVSGTHPFQHWSQRKIYPSERYQYLLDKFQWLARRVSSREQRLPAVVDALVREFETDAPSHFSLKASPSS